MKKFLEKVTIVLRDPTLRKRIAFTLGALVVFRLLSAIPIPGIDLASLERLLAGNQFLGLLDIFSGGGISRLSIVMLGVGPYITGSIIMQLLTMMFPSMKAMMQEEGEAGRQKLSQYSRYLSVPLAALQAFAFISLFQSQNVIPHFTGLELFVNILIVTAGSLLLMWIGELISEFGIGNGVSLLIFAGIVAALPQKIFQFIAGFDAAQLPLYLLSLVIALFVIIAVVVVTAAPVPEIVNVTGTPLMIEPLASLTVAVAETTADSGVSSPSIALIVGVDDVTSAEVLPPVKLTEPTVNVP